LPEERLEVAVKGVEEFMHVDQVVNADWITRFFEFWFFFDDLALVFDAQLLKGRPSLSRIAIADQRRDEVPSLTVDTLHNHHPDIGFSREDMDIVGTKSPVANGTTVHSLQNNAFDLSL